MSQGNHQGELVLHNATVLTVDSNFSVAEAIIIRNGTITDVGTNSEILARASKDAAYVDVGGRTVIPGLIDSHVHLYNLAVNAPRVQLFECRSISDVLAAIGERAKRSQPGEWVLASSGWHESMLAENRLPTRDELDEVAPHNPVFIPRGGHVGSANSLALELGGIDEDTPDPPGGLIVREVNSRRPTGVLLETAAFNLRKLPPLPSLETEKKLLKDAMGILNSYGIVSTLEPGLNQAQIALYEDLRASGDLTLRLDLMYRANNLEETKTGLSYIDFPNDEMLRFVGIKFMLDGGIEGARLSEPYRIVPGEQNDPNYHGLFILPPGGEPEFIECLKLVAKAGLQAQSHGVGDDGIDLIVRSYEAVNTEIPIRDLRWVVMHVHLPREDALQKMIDHGMLATVQDQSVLLGANMVKWWGRERANFAAPTRLLLDKGIVVGGGTDAPILPIDPFICMWWMVTRKTLQGDLLGLEQAITAREALELYTINNAKIMGVEHARGSIEPGKMADIAILTDNPLSIPADSIRDIRALMTIVGGNIVYRNGL